MNIVSEEIIPDFEAKKILEMREKEVEIKYEQKNSLDIIRKFSKFPEEKLKSLVEDLKKIEKLRDRYIVSIVNFLPEDREDLRVVLYKDYSTLTDDEINQILEAVKKNL